MDDSISRQAAIDAVRNYPDDLISQLMAIEALPSAQPEIIRCKECKYYHENVFGDDIGIGRPYDVLIVAHNGCDRWGGRVKKDMHCVKPDGFCFLAERRTDEL